MRDFIEFMQFLGGLILFFSIFLLFTYWVQSAVMPEFVDLECEDTLTLPPSNGHDWFYNISLTDGTCTVTIASFDEVNYLQVHDRRGVELSADNKSLTEHSTLSKTTLLPAATLLSRNSVIYLLSSEGIPGQLDIVSDKPRIIKLATHLALPENKE